MKRIGVRLQKTSGSKERRDPTKKAHPPPTISTHPSPHCEIVVLRLASLSMSRPTERTPQDDIHEYILIRISTFL